MIYPFFCIFAWPKPWFAWLALLIPPHHCYRPNVWIIRSRSNVQWTPLKADKSGWLLCGCLLTTVYVSHGNCVLPYAVRHWASINSGLNTGRRSATIPPINSIIFVLNYREIQAKSSNLNSKSTHGCLCIFCTMHIKWPWLFQVNVWIHVTNLVLIDVDEQHGNHCHDDHDCGGGDTKLELNRRKWVKFYHTNLEFPSCYG